MAVNERLLSTLDPSGVLEMIADSLKTVVAYDSLTIYRIDKERGVRRPVIARDRFAELILGYDAPLGTGLTGWAVDHREPVLANDAHLDTRSIQIPGTPFEPESMVIVPLMAEGEVLGTLNIGRMGGDEAHYSQNEFELTKLFAAQAAIALRNAEAHDEVKVQAERDALTGLRNHGAFQRELRRLPRRGDRPAGHRPDDGSRPVQGLQRPERPSRRRRAAGRGQPGDRVVHPPGRPGLPLRRRRVRGDPARLRAPGGRGGRAPDPRRDRGDPRRERRPHVTISVGIACHPEDATDKETLVETADQALFLAKGAPFRSSRDQFVAALDETAMGLLDGSGTEELLDSILIRAARLLGVRTATSTSASRATRTSRCAPRSASWPSTSGFQLPGRPGRRRPGLPNRQAVRRRRLRHLRGRARPSSRARSARASACRSRSAGASSACSASPRARPSGCSGSPRSTRSTKFAQLASIALENARLQEQALSPRDPVTGLPTRETLIQRVVDALAPPPAGSAAASRCPWCSSTSTGSRSSTRASATRPATASCARSASGSPPSSARTTRSRDSAATRSACSCRAATPTRAMAFAERVQLELKPPFDLDGRTWFISASMGVVGRRAGRHRRRRHPAGGRDRARRREAPPDPPRRPVRPAQQPRTPASDSTSRPSCGAPSSATSSPSTTSRSSTSGRCASSASRRSPGGSTRRAASSCRSTSSPSPRSPS